MTDYNYREKNWRPNFNNFIIYLIPILLALVIFLLSRPDFTPKVLAAAPLRGNSGDLWADIVIGKSSFGEDTPGEVVSYKTMNPGGVTIDRSVRPNRVYVYDGSNSRILGYKSLGICKNNTSKACTVDSDCSSSVCVIQVGGQLGKKTADIVIGQPDFTHAACNGDSNFQNYPQRAPASAKSLCSMPESQISTTEGGSYASLTVDKQGNLYVADFDNNRILKYTSPFTTDRTADSVWGQSDFTGNSCNRGQGIGHPANNTLCFRSPYNEGFSAGTDIDKSGNLWVTDNQNDRVLRFSKNSSGIISQTANLVLGQPDFVSANTGSSLNQMHAPVAVRTDQSTGRVYVADSLNNRILFFDPPFSSGMTATGTFASNLHNPTGIDFDTLGQGIWVNDTGNNQVVLFNSKGSPIKVLFKDTYQPNGGCGSSTVDYYNGCINLQTDPSTGQKVCWANMCNVTGSIGIDVDGNIYPGGNSFEQDVFRFKAPIPTPVQGKVYSASSRFYYPPDSYNFLYGSRGFASPRSIVVAGGQFIVADQSRIMYWNIPNGLNDLTNGKPADGVAGTSNFNVPDPWGYLTLAAQGNQYLWVGHMGYIEVYSLPLTFGAKPLKTAVSVYNTGIPVLGGGQIANQWNTNEYWADLEVSPDGQSLWASQPFYNRVVRIRNPFTSPVIDVVLGQKTAVDSSCNQGDPNYPPIPSDNTNYPLNYLCNPGGMKFDRNGNLFLSDHWLEVSGNFRMLQFNSNIFSASSSSALFDPPASRSIPNSATWKPAFDSANHLVVGFNGYRGSRFPGVFTNPLIQTAADKYLNDYYSMPVYSVFDQSDNLFVSDLDRGRILIYKNPLNTSHPTPTP